MSIVKNTSHFRGNLGMKTIKTIVKDCTKFIIYVDSFYGPDGLYPMGATVSQICEAISILLNEVGTNVAFDSIDRERVRDIMIEKFGLIFPKD